MPFYMSADTYYLQYKMNKEIILSEALTRKKAAREGKREGKTCNIARYIAY
jgi:hypothetical protein